MLPICAAGTSLHDSSNSCIIWLLRGHPPDHLAACCSVLVDLLRRQLFLKLSPWSGHVQSGLCREATG